jgi:Domain of unknown function (DUF222)/HNH endonuclease
MEITSAEEAIASMSAGLDWLADNDPSLYCDGATIKALERQGSRLGCATSRAVTSFETWGEWGREGAKSATAWIDTTCHVPKTEARAQLRRGRALSSLPAVARAWMSGDIGAAHVDAFLRIKRPVTEEALKEAEEILVDLARTAKFAEFAIALAYFEQHADQDGTDEAAEAKKTQRDVYLYPSPNGYLGEMRFDTLGGAIVANELKRIEDEFFDADWAEAKARLGREPRADELIRTPAQRRADAMTEMAVRSASARPGVRRPEPLFTVLIDYPTLYGRIAQLEDGSVVAPGSLLSWLTAATFERIVFAPGKRAECSVRSRFFTGATRRAVEVRDRQCQHEYCDICAAECEMDHIVPWSQGGLTEQGNGQVLCRYHNRLRYERPPPDG